MNPKFTQLYMDIAHRVAQLSYARRLKVGCVIVKDDAITYGYNGTPSGWDNNCEYEEVEMRAVYGVGTEMVKTGELKTKPEVLHSEMNALMKIARSTISSVGADLFVTHAPCMDCAKAIYQAGVKRVFFGQQYRDDSGLKFLKNSGVEVGQITTDD